MADFYSPEDLQRIQSEYAYHLEKGIPVSKELATEFANAKTGVKNYTQELNNSLKKLGSGLMDTAGALKDGKQGAAVFSKNLADGADALEAFLSKFGILGTMLGKLLTAGAKYANEASKQGDALFKSYQDLSRIGAATAKGMSDVFPTMQKFGYNIEELDKMTALIKENSKSLALYSGTVSQGSAQLANIAQDFKDSGDQVNFRKMGMSIDDINRGIAGYSKQIGSLGQNQGKTQAELTKGAAAYIREMEILTRLTGQSREEMEQQRDAANQIDEFYATISEMGPQGAELQKVFNHLMAIDPSGSKARGFAESVSGFISGSKDQDKLLNLTGMQVLTSMEDLKSGAITGAQYLDKIGMAAKDQEQNLRGFAKMGGMADYAGSLVSGVALMNRQTEKSTKTAEDQIKVDDKLTTASVDLRTSQMKTTAALQSMINDGVLPATEGMRLLADAAETAADATKSGWDTFWGWFSGDKAKKEKPTPPKQMTGSSVNEQRAAQGKPALSSEAAEAEAARQQSEQELKRRNESRERRKLGIVDQFAEENAAPSGPTARSVGAPSTKMAAGQKDLANLGLKIKQGDVQAEGAQLESKLIDLAKATQSGIPGFQWFTGFNDRFHNEKSPGSEHTKGRAFDFVVDRKPSREEGQQIVSALKSMGASYVQDEYNDPSRGATGGHFHAAVSARNGFNGLLTGPAGGYRPNIEMHGTEQLSIKPMSTPSGGSGFSDSDPGQLLKKQLEKMDRLVQIMDTQTTSDLMSQQLNRLDELVRVMQNQVSVSTKILQQSR